MKIILAALVSLFACRAAQAQFSGKLTYRIVNPTSTLTMVYYQNGNNARVDARSVSNTDTTQVVNVQDTLLFDLAAHKTTHLQYKTGMAYIMPNTGAMAQQVAAATNSTVTVQTIGAETVNGYACTHYQMLGKTGSYVSKREIWVTASLGTPGIQVAGGYLYWTPEFVQETKLLAAGGAGVVVKSLVNMPGLMTTMDLIAVDTNPPNGSLFAVPSRYTLVDRSQMTIPAH
ncbi:MAG TPA: DUF4412 domain-containing protein [Puia sp.]|uniref:DUF4412 domain-containing protein n=1 Tax=Puia sp. TaxID=2045100 RepID=UPI002CD1B11F|nr:DUF4412 domain-containing protein [Puia sp.]HVU98654.1 DUF4412 domain-containing protein [Puia sp.]